MRAALVTTLLFAASCLGSPDDIDEEEQAVNQFTYSYAPGDSAAIGVLAKTAPWVVMVKRTMPGPSVVQTPKDAYLADPSTTKCELRVGADEWEIIKEILMDVNQADAAAAQAAFQKYQKVNQFPLLQIGNEFYLFEQNSSKKWFARKTFYGGVCTGTQIRAGVVVTAGHCLFPVQDTLDCLSQAKIAPPDEQTFVWNPSAGQVVKASSTQYFEYSGPGISQPTTWEGQDVPSNKTKLLVWAKYLSGLNAKPKPALADGTELSMTPFLTSDNPLTSVVDLGLIGLSVPIVLKEFKANSDTYGPYPKIPTLDVTEIDDIEKSQLDARVSRAMQFGLFFGSSLPVLYTGSGSTVVANSDQTRSGFSIVQSDVKVFTAALKHPNYLRTRIAQDSPAQPGDSGGGLFQLDPKIAAKLIAAYSFKSGLGLTGPGATVNGSPYNADVTAILAQNWGAGGPYSLLVGAISGEGYLSGKVSANDYPVLKFDSKKDWGEQRAQMRALPKFLFYTNLTNPDIRKSIDFIADGLGKSE